MAASSRPIDPRDLVPDSHELTDIVGQIVDREGQGNGIDMTNTWPMINFPLSEVIHILHFQQNLTDQEQAAYEVVMHAIQEALSAFNPNADGGDQ
ncbi:Protein CBG27403 [Caenorhabditis briggsae]|uniref:Protein CBG27403 n=1 Tax=Caenorhabditis briggsae TaxID=6238 RepID=B6IJY0_CAEBR|nr:Protein CBG27403 [Caenorhabditis briggsae]CAS00210.1 Protein CBG27403 [Caenorhabditis briggsae]